MIKERGRLIYRENLPADGVEVNKLRAALGTDTTVVLDGDHFAVIEERSVGADGKRVTFVLREWEPSAADLSDAPAEHDATEHSAKRSRRG